MGNTAKRPQKARPKHQPDTLGLNHAVPTQCRLLCAQAGARHGCVPVQARTAAWGCTARAPVYSTAHAVQYSLYNDTPTDLPSIRPHVACHVRGPRRELAVVMAHLPPQQKSVRPNNGVLHTMCAHVPMSVHRPRPPVQHTASDLLEQLVGRERVVHEAVDQCAPAHRRVESAEIKVPAESGRHKRQAGALTRAAPRRHALAGQVVVLSPGR